MVGYKYSPNSGADISLDAVTTGTGSVKALNDCRQCNWMFIGAGTITGGTVVVESATAIDYAGTWNELDTLTASDLSGGKATGGTYPMPPGGFVRGRVSSNITGGGTITVKINGLLG